MTYQYDALALDTGAYSVTYDSANPYMWAPVQDIATPYLARPGGALVRLESGMRLQTLGGRITAASITALETARDTMITTFKLRKRRLLSYQLGNRYVLATPRNLQTKLSGPQLATWTCDFLSEDAYESALTPSGDSRTPTLALLPGETTAYGLSYSLTPGGSAPAPVRWLLVNQAAGVTPAVWQISNLTTQRGIATSASVPAGSALYVDPNAGMFVSPMTNVLGYWPLADASGSALDYSSQSRDLTTNGAITYLADGPQDSQGAGFPGAGTAFFNSASAAFQVTSDLSLCCWVKFAALSGNNVPLSKAGANTGYSLMVNTTTANFSRGTGAAVVTSTLTQTLTTGVWYFLCGTYSSANTRQRLYFGTEYQFPALQAQSTASLATSNAANDLRVGTGHYTDGTAYPVNGTVAHAAVYNAELTAAQIVNIWKRGPQAISDSGAYVNGAFPTLDPGLGTTNLIQVRADHGTTLPTIRAAAMWRSRFD